MCKGRSGPLAVSGKRHFFATVICGHLIGVCMYGLCVLDMEALSTCRTVLSCIRCQSKPPGDIAPTKSHPRQSVFFQSWKCPIRGGQRQIDAAANHFGSNRNICDIQKVKDFNPGPCCTKVGVIQGCRQSEAFNGCGWRKGACRLFMTQIFLFVMYWCLWYFTTN